LRVPPIGSGKRCNCSICVRRGAVMSVPYYRPEDFEELSGKDALAVYRFGDHLVNHYFCRRCGVYPFHEAIAEPGHLRVNLGCIDGLDVLALPVEIIDGASF
jgi:hypothetical protein